MAHYDPKSFEKKWQEKWHSTKAYQAENSSSLPKCYVLDMFPYPSGAGLHVGHPLGYIASDIYARFKRLQGFNVLHPMGYDAFGLPAEQYAIQTGQHPAVTTEENIRRYREQLDKIGFSFDWERQVKTCDPDYYRWTQWIFLKLFGSWYNPVSNKAEPIETLVAQLEEKGYAGNRDTALTGGLEVEIPAFSAELWKSFSEERKQEFLLNFRLAFLSEAFVNWCPALGTVLANEEVKDGVSERGGYLVERKLMRQWSLRITAYAERLLEGLNRIDWSESIKEAQRNWIGKSEGSSLFFSLVTENGGKENRIEVFTTRPDTIFGVTFLVLAPEHPLVSEITSPEKRALVNSYVSQAKNRTERERMADVKHVSGAFTGAYALHPFTGQHIPVWVGDYVLAGYGTGAVMAVPAHDSRDHLFARHFGLDILQVVRGSAEADIQETSYDAKEGTLINSGFLDGLPVQEAAGKAIAEIERRGFGKGKTNYRLRDAIFGRQRYWGEPIPVRFINGLPYPLEESELPLELPEIDKFLPTEDGEPPLARAAGWKYETTTMPGWAGSSWYFLRYMDPGNAAEFADNAALDYWQNVDLYIGGSEHATGHLLYARFWMKFLYDLGYVKHDEPFKKLVNQGMIQGRSSLLFVLDLPAISYRIHPGTEGYEEIVSAKQDAASAEKEVPEAAVATTLKLVLSQSIAKEFESGKKSIQDIFREHDLYNRFDLHGDVRQLQASDIRKIRSHVDVAYVKSDRLDISSLKKDPRYTFYRAGYVFIEEEVNGERTFICDWEVEKMSKSKYNVVNPDDICEEYGADTLRLYEMFLGPLEMSKPWNTNGIEGVFRFLAKLWKLYVAEDGHSLVNEETPTKEELKVLHKAIKKVGEDIEAFSFNTSVSTFMITVNELTALKCRKREILEPLLIILSPFAPHIAEELWSRTGNDDSVTKQRFPEFSPDCLIESSFSYPVSVNGKTRANIDLSLDLTEEEAKKAVLENETVQKWMEGKPLRKFIFVKGRIINLVI